MRNPWIEKSFEQYPQIQRLWNLDGIEEAWHQEKQHAEMKVDMNVGVFVEGAHPEQPVGPDEHDADESQAVEAEAGGIERDIILEVSFDFVLAVHELVYQFVVDSTYNPQHTRKQTIKLLLVYTHPVLEVVNDEDENRTEEVHRVHHRQRQVELRSTYRQHVKHHDQVSLEQVAESYVVLIVESHIVVSGEWEVEDDGGDAPEERCFDGVDFVVVGVDEAEGEEHLGAGKEDIGCFFGSEFFDKKANHGVSI